MRWLLLTAGAIALTLLVRWLAAAVWVRFISDRWSEFDSDGARD